MVTRGIKQRWRVKKKYSALTQVFLKKGRGDADA